MAATAAVALFTLAIGAAIPTVSFVRERRALAALDARIARLAPEVQRAEEPLADVERARRELATLREFEERGLHPLPVLRELTDTIPGRRVADELSVDRNGTRAGWVRQRRLAAHPAARGLPLPRARGVHLAGDEGPGPRAVPAPRRLGAAWRSALDARSSSPRAPSPDPRGLIAIGVAGYVYVVEPLVEAHAATRELVVARRGLLARQERLVARSDAVRKGAGELRAEIDRRRQRLLAGDKAPVAASSSRSS
jgi:hypothetical protein